MYVLAQERCRGTPLRVQELGGLAPDMTFFFFRNATVSITVEQL